MAIVRILDLKDSNCCLFLKSEADFDLHLKKAILYWAEKTKNLNDEDFSIWIKEQNEKGTLIYEDDRNGIKEYLSLADFSLITDEQTLMFFGYASMMGHLIDANDLSNKDKEHIVDDPYNAVSQDKQSTENIIQNTDGESFKSIELIVPFLATEFSNDGTHVQKDKFILNLQREWEEIFHNKFNPFFANAIEGHPSAMLRLTNYMDTGEEINYDFGMELIDGEIKIETNLEIEKFSKFTTVYAIGSQLQLEDDEPILLIKNDSLKEDILVLKYIPENDGYDNEFINMPVDSISRIFK